MKKMKKIALIIAVFMLMAVCFAFGVSALDATGQCGDNVYWNYDEATGELVISGEGVMYDYDYSFNSPFYGSDIKSVIIQEDVTGLGDYAFYECNELVSLSIGRSLNHIGKDAFYRTDAVERIVVDINNEVFYADSYGVLYNKNEHELIKFPVASKIATYTIDSDTERVHKYAFWNAFNLVEVRIPDNIYIDEFAFMKCVRLENIIFPNNVSNISIGSGAFMHCCSLETVSIPAGTTIQDNSFSLCYGLKNVYIDDDVKIEGVAIVESPFLEKIYIKGMETELGPYSICACEGTVIGLSRKEFVDAYLHCMIENTEEYWDIINNAYKPAEDIIFIGTIYCHSGSTAEAYAIANGMDYELIHFFKGEWTYDYDNMIRTRKCIHCDELETEELEKNETGDIEIIEPVDPDTDFEVDEITDYIIIDEAINNGVDGEYAIVKAFDITMKNKEGVHVQPDGTVKVKLPNDWSKKGVYKVYRVNDDGTLTDMNAYRQGSHLVFDTDHFSIYVIVVEGEGVADNEPETPEIPEEPDTTDCGCICHKSGWIYEFLTIIFKLVAKIGGMFQICDCGIAHY